MWWMRRLPLTWSWALLSRKARVLVAVALCWFLSGLRKQQLSDGRETAPAEASADMFMQDAESMPYLQAWQSGKSVGVPGVVALYRKAHEQHGRLPWSRLFQPAIRLAETGFEVSPRLADMLLRVAKFTRLDENPGAADYFYPDGEALIAGQLRKNPEYARTLRALAEEGIGTFYGGALAEQIVAAAQAQPDQAVCGARILRAMPCACGLSCAVDLERWRYAPPRRLLLVQCKLWFRFTTTCGGRPALAEKCRILWMHSALPMRIETIFR